MKMPKMPKMPTMLKMPTSQQLGQVMKFAQLASDHVQEAMHGVSPRTRMRLAIVGGGAVLALLVTVVATTGQEVHPAIPAAATLTASAPAAGAALLIADGTDAEGKIRLRLNKSAVITTKVPYKRVNVSQPEVADLNLIGPESILVTAKKPGTTQMILWDDANRSQVVDVSVQVDMETLREQIKNMFPSAKIEVTSANGVLALKGRVPTLETAEQALSMAQPYSSGKVLNFLQVAGGQQVMLQVRFAEVSRSAASALGVNFGATDGRSYGGNNSGQVNPFGILGATDSLPDRLAIASPNAAVTLFGRGQVGQSTFAYFISALRQNNLMRILAEPNLTAISGQEASFLAGGEFPVPVPQSGSNGSTTITIEYREFGVKLKFVPTVLGDGQIRLTVAPEVSDLDFTTAVRFGGFVVPGLTSRKLSTTVELTEGQTFALAGLLNQNVAASKDVTPLLGDLPVVGALFRSVRYQRRETELVVLVTPHLVEAINPDQVPTLPGEQWRHPTENELFWAQNLGGEQPNTHVLPATQPASDQPAPRFRGEYGFTPVQSVSVQ